MKRFASLALAAALLVGCGGGGGGGVNPGPVDPGYISLLDAATEARVDQVVRDYQFTHHIAGATVGVVKDGKVVLVKGYGVSDLGPGTSADANTPFEIGSCTKSFTAFGLLRMVDDPSLITKPGVVALDLDERVAVYLADSPNVSIPPAWEDITVRELLSMTSGIEDGSSNTKIWQVIVAEAAARGVEFAPGTGYCYSNPGYMVLGELIQQLSGKAYADYMKQYVFTPLGLTNTIVHLPGNAPATLSKGYSWQGSAWIEPEKRSPLSSFSSGAVITTAGDLAKFLLALQQQKILKPATYEAMWTPIELPTRSSEWGLGWNVVQTEDYKIYRKDGGLPGYSAQMSIYVHAGVSVALCTNETSVPTAQIVADIVAAIRDVESEPNPPAPQSDCD
jgi:CubicO group peptidase (beta-lactamase class C family)